MISYIHSRDLFQEQQKSLFDKGDVLIIVSEEYLMEKFKLSPNGKNGTIFYEELKSSTEKLFSSIRNDKDFKDKYRTLEGKNDLTIVILTTTDEGFVNTANYITDLLDKPTN